jgi:hypothetical protein
MDQVIFRTEGHRHAECSGRFGGANLCSHTCNYCLVSTCPAARWKHGGACWPRYREPVGRHRRIFVSGLPDFRSWPHLVGRFASINRDRQELDRHCGDIRHVPELSFHRLHWPVIFAASRSGTSAPDGLRQTKQGTSVRRLKRRITPESRGSGCLLVTPAWAVLLGPGPSCRDQCRGIRRLSRKHRRG